MVSPKRARKSWRKGQKRWKVNWWNTFRHVFGQNIFLPFERSVIKHASSEATFFTENILPPYTKNVNKQNFWFSCLTNSKFNFNHSEKTEKYKWFWIFVRVFFLVFWHVFQINKNAIFNIKFRLWKSRKYLLISVTQFLECKFAFETCHLEIFFQFCFVFLILPVFNFNFFAGWWKFLTKQSCWKKRKKQSQKNLLSMLLSISFPMFAYKTESTRS